MERVEISLAASRADFYNANRGKNGRAKKIVDFLPFRDAWKPEEESQPQSIHALAMAMGGVKRADNHR